VEKKNTGRGRGKINDSEFTQKNSSQVGENQLASRTGKKKGASKERAAGQKNKRSPGKHVGPTIELAEWPEGEFCGKEAGVRGRAMRGDRGGGLKPFTGQNAAGANGREKRRILTESERN